VVRCLFFDIDGTLVDTGGAGRRALEGVFNEMFGLRGAFEGIHMAGRTDPQIIREALQVHGLPSEDPMVRTVLEQYPRHLRRQMASSGARLLPGVREALAALEGRAGFYLGLLTGNIEAGARIKLEALGLGGRFLTGAFGGDHEQRDLLLPIARERFQKLLGLPVPYEACVVIGDTPMDVHCARPYGAVTLAVTTGPYDRETLEKSGAHFVLSDLSEVPAILEDLVLPAPLG